MARRSFSLEGKRPGREGEGGGGSPPFSLFTGGFVTVFPFSSQGGIPGRTRTCEVSPLPFFFTSQRDVALRWDRALHCSFGLVIEDPSSLYTTPSFVRKASLSSFLPDAVPAPDDAAPCGEEKYEREEARTVCAAWSRLPV